MNTTVKEYFKVIFGKLPKYESGGSKAPSRWTHILAHLIWDFCDHPFLGPIVEKLRVVTLRIEGKK